MNSLFSFDRRINRTTYFVGLIVGFIGLIVITGLLTFISSLLSIHLIKIAAVVIVILATLAYTFYALCLTKQRANDISGENSLLYTFLAVFVLSVLVGVIPGEKRRNRYGDIPQKGLSLR